MEIHLPGREAGLGPLVEEYTRQAARLAVARREEGGAPLLLLPHQARQAGREPRTPHLRTSMFMYNKTTFSVCQC